jgi:hypothetical protein
LVEHAHSLVEDVEHTNRFALPSLQGQRDHVACYESGVLINSTIMAAGVCLYIAGDSGLSRLKDGTGDTLVPGNARAAGHGLFAQGVLEDQLLVLGISQKDRSGFGANLIQGDPKGGFDKFVQVDCLEKGLTDTLNRLQFVVVLLGFYVPGSEGPKYPTRKWSLIRDSHNPSLANI